MIDGEKLQVFEYNGTARSGKGSIVAWLSEVHPEVATDETGADYRTLTYFLVDGELIDPEMPAENIAKTIEKLSVGSLSEFVAQRQIVEEQLGSDTLYSPEVSSLVHHVAPLEVVRDAVKKGFSKRVEQVRDNEEHRILLVDGRNLTPVITSIKGTELVMRTFVYCIPIEGAYRECVRAGLEPGTEAWDAAFMKNLEMIEERNAVDSNRAQDPVVQEANAINYWGSNALMRNTVRLYSDYLFDGDEAEAMRYIFTSDNSDFTDVPRIGAGYKAVKENRQVYFNTTPFRTYSNSKHAMLLAANNMFEEAIRAREIIGKIA